MLLTSGNGDVLNLYISLFQYMLDGSDIWSYKSAVANYEISHMTAFKSLWLYHMMFIFIVICCIFSVLCDFVYLVSFSNCVTGYVAESSFLSPSSTATGTHHHGYGMLPPPPPQHTHTSLPILCFPWVCCRFCFLYVSKIIINKVFACGGRHYVVA